MHPNAQTLQRFYTAFSQLDHATMAACYAPHATFEDEAFSLKGRDEIGGMWRMLCTASSKPEAAKHWKLDFSGIEADANGGKAHWEAHYLFSATGRTVHNIVDGTFTFTPDGLIATHRDRLCDGELIIDGDDLPVEQNRVWSRSRLLRAAQDRGANEPGCQEQVHP